MKKPKLRIVFDANPLMGKRTGIGHYTSRLLAHIAETHPDDIELVGFYYNFMWRKPAPESPQAPNIRYKAISLIPGPVVNLLRRHGLELPIEFLTLMKADFLLFTNFLGYPSLFKTPNAPAIHDLTYLDLPTAGSDKNVRDLTLLMPATIRRASFIITVSEFSKSRIADTYKIEPGKILTTFIPPEKPLALTDEQAQKKLAMLSIKKPYLYFVGTLEPRKNITALLDAYTQLPKKTQETYTLVITGKMDWKYQHTKDKLEALQTSGYNIIYTGYIDNQTQAALYHQASLFVLPSLYEGFGMPILEALSYDVPCAVSNISVFHEVGGEAVAYFNPESPADIAKTINSVLKQPKLKNPTLQSYLRSKPSWSDVSRQVAESIRKAVN